MFWGVYAVASAHYAQGLGSLIEAVNVLGSLFYGGMLGVFVLAFFFKRVGARGAFYGVLVGEAVIFACWYFTSDRVPLVQRHRLRRRADGRRRDFGGDARAGGGKLRSHNLELTTLNLQL